jgi:hypothetical protein
MVHLCNVRVLKGLYIGVNGSMQANRKISILLLLVRKWTIKKIITDKNVHNILILNGAGDGNRTHVISLGS